MSNIRIDIASEFKDKGFKDAGKATSRLGKSFDRLAHKLGAALSVVAIARFSKAAIKAFTEDEKAASRLAATYNNLGLAVQAIGVNDYIDQLQRATGVADTELRPAIETLSRATLNYSEAQSLLNTALNISAGTGKDLQTVSVALSRARLGEVTALGKLNIGIGKTEAKTMSFQEALSRLNTDFAGQAGVAAETYAGKMSRLKIAAGEAQETIGKGLIVAITKLSANQNLNSVTDEFDRIAKNVAATAIGVADIVENLNKKVNASAAGGWITSFNDFMDKFNIFVQQRDKVLSGVIGGVKQRTIGAPGLEKSAKEQAKILKQQKAEQDKIIKAQQKAEKDRLKREKEAQQLKRAGTVFDMENIQIVAAMQGKIDGDQRLRLTALLAINQGNADAAEKLSTAILAANSAALTSLGVMMKAGDSIDDVVNKILQAQTKASLLALGIANIPKAKNPFEDWVDIIAKLLGMVDQLSQKISTINKPAIAGGATSTTTSVTTATGITTTTKPLTPDQIAMIDMGVPNLVANAGLYNPSVFSQGTLFPKSNVPDIAAATGLYDPNPFKKVGSNVSVQVNVAGSVISEGDLANKIIDQLYAYQSSGNKVLYEQVQV